MKQKVFAKLSKFGELKMALDIAKNSFYEFLQPDCSKEQRKNQGLEKVFREVFPIEDIHGNFRLEYLGYELAPSFFSEEEAIERGATYSRPLLGTFRLIKLNKAKEVEEVLEQKVYICDVPFITEAGSFIINGIERVVVSQLLRSPGLYFLEKDRYFIALVVPERGAWFQINVSPSNTLEAVFERKRKVPLFTLFRSLRIDFEELGRTYFKVEEASPTPGYFLAQDVRDEEGILLARFGDKITKELSEYLEEKGVKKVSMFTEDRLGVTIFINSVRADRSKSPEDALRRMYNRLRGTNPSTLDLAKRMIFGLIFDPNRFNLGKTGRYKVNTRLGRKSSEGPYPLTEDDLITITKFLLEFSERKFYPDDMEHLANRRIKAVGAQLEEIFRQAFLQLTQIVKERASFLEDKKITPINLLNSPIVSNNIVRFFTTSSVSQFMDQTNPLAALTHKKRLTTLGPGGLTKQTAGFETRDVHYSHYGKICPIETPEGQNIGLITSLGFYSRINEYGFIESPYVEVKNGEVTGKIKFLSPDEEENCKIAYLDEVSLNNGKIAAKEVVVRKKEEILTVPAEEVDYIDFSPKQIFSVATSLIPFLEHDDADRALMGSNMQRQAVPLLLPEPPCVATGVESLVAKEAGSVITSNVDGIVRQVDATRILIETEEGFEEYRLKNFGGSNQYTCIHFRPCVNLGDEVKKGQIIANGPSTAEGMLALGKNVLIAYMPLWGYNYEDAIVVSERLLKEDTFTSIQVLEYEIEVRETKLGSEEVTRDIPGATESELMNLDEFGIVRIGAVVNPDDILVGRITPKEDTAVTPEERLLRAIFGEKAAEARDTSLRLPPGVKGTVIGRRVLTRSTQDPLAKRVISDRVKNVEKKFTEKRRLLEEQRAKSIKQFLLNKRVVSDVKDRSGHTILKKGEKFDKKVLDSIEFEKIRFKKIRLQEDEQGVYEELLKKYENRMLELNKEFRNALDNAERGDDLPLGVLKSITVYVAQKRKLCVGDKFSGRHGNKGVVGKILPEEDMPHLLDGRPVDMVLNTLGVPSRMNIGQILEAVLGYAAKKLGYQAICPIFEGATSEEIKNELKKAGLPESGKLRLRDGRTGKLFDQEAVVGYMYMMKLIHMVEDKIHARSIGPYSLITQQPLGGKAQFGGQRFGEMEVWALEAYGAAYTLQEMLTIKSDDVKGRNALYEALIKGEAPSLSEEPTSFSVLVKELRGVGINVIPIKEGGRK